MTITHERAAQAASRLINAFFGNGSRPKPQIRIPANPEDDDIILTTYIEQQRKRSSQSPEELAQKFHEAYERLAPSFGYETRKASAKPWAEVPENNRRLMTAVCAEILR